MPMTLLQAIILGAVQGITEFLPISSTAHLVLVPWFMGFEDPGLGFDVALHLGTLVALLLYFRAEWYQLALGTPDLLQRRWKNPQARLLLYLILATIPGLIAGALLADFADNALRHPLVIASTLIVLALVLVVAERTGKRQTRFDDISLKDAVAIGCAQALAIVPGVSRSGVTITAGLFRGVTREASARFSFFLSTPIIGAAVSKALFDGIREGFPAVDATSVVAGIFASGVVGYLSIAFLLRYLATRTTFAFIYYRIVLGIVVATAFLNGFRT